MAAPTAPPTTSTQPPKLTPADIQRSAQIALAQRSYRGDFDPPLLKDNSPISWIRNSQTPDFNVILNEIGPIVDTGLEFLFGGAFTVIVDPATKDAKAAQMWLDDCWGDPDDMMTFWGEVGQNGFIGGHAFVKAQAPDDDGDGAEFEVQDPEYLAVCTDPHNKRKALGFQIRYQLGSGLDAQMYCQYVSRPDTKSQQWKIQTFQTKGSQSQVWQLVEQVDWPYPYCPLQDCQNLTETREYWGKSDTTPDLIGLNKALNLNASNINKIGWHQGFPWPWASGFAGKIEPEPGKLIKLPSAQAKMGILNVEADLSKLLEHMAELRANVDQVSGVPSLATGRVSELPRGQISGIAIEMLYQRLVAKTIKKRRLYGRLIRDLCGIQLYHGGFTDPDDPCSVKLKISWPDLLPVDELQSWQAAILQDQLGVSHHSIYGTRGLDYDQEVRQKAEEDAQAALLSEQGRGPAPQAIDAAKQPLPGEGMQQAMTQQPAPTDAQMTDQMDTPMPDSGTGLGGR
jgi:hypothetical protein